MISATPRSHRPPAHPATSISRRTRPQSLNSMVISTATGRIHRASGCGIVRGRPLVLPGLVAIEVAQLDGLHVAEQVLNHGLRALHRVERRGVAALEHIVDQGVGHSLQGAALLSGGVRPAGAREFGERERGLGG